MLNVRTTFSQFDEESIIFLTPPGFQLNFQTQYIVSTCNDDRAFLVCNSSGQTYELKTLQSTNQLFLTKDLQNKTAGSQNINLFAGCSKYIEIVKTQPNILEIIRQVIQLYNQSAYADIKAVGHINTNVDSVNVPSVVTITSSVPEFVEFAANYLIVSGQECYYDNNIHSEVAIMLARFFIDCDTKYDDLGYLCLADPIFLSSELQKKVDSLPVKLCAFPMLLFYADFNVPEYCDNNIHLKRTQPDYTDLLTRIVYSGSLSIFEPIPMFSDVSSDHEQNQSIAQYQCVDITPLVNKHLQIRLDCVKIISEILMKAFLNERIQTVNKVIQYLKQYELPPQFYIELVWQLRAKFSEQIKQFKRPELIDIEINNLQLLPEVICLLCSAKTVGSYRPRSQTCYINFTHKLGLTTQIVYLDELSLGKDVERAYQLSKIAKYWNQDQLRRLCGDQFTNYFRDDQKRADEDAYESGLIQLYTFKNELSFMV